MQKIGIGLLMTAVSLGPGLWATEAATLVVLNKAEATASLIDLSTGEVAATLPTGEGPHEAAASPDGKTVVGCDYGTRDNPGSSLTVIDVERAEVVKTIDLGDYSRPHGILWMEDGRRVIVTAEDQKALLIVDVETGVVERAIDTDQGHLSYGGRHPRSDTGVCGQYRVGFGDGDRSRAR